MVEDVDIATMIDDAMKLNSASLERHHIAVKSRLRQHSHSAARYAESAADPRQPDQERQRRHVPSSPSKADRQLTLRTAIINEQPARNPGDRQWRRRAAGKPDAHLLSRIHDQEDKATDSDCTAAPMPLVNWAARWWRTATAPGKGATLILELPYVPAEVAV